MASSCGTGAAHAIQIWSLGQRRSKRYLNPVDPVGFNVLGRTFVKRSLTRGPPPHNRVPPLRAADLDGRKTRPGLAGWLDRPAHLDVSLVSTSTYRPVSPQCGDVISSLTHA
jgi:hypothetical protein